MTLTCAHCQEPYSLDNNHHGACAYAPADSLRRGIEMLTCLQCAKCLLYHCLSDAEGDYTHPCDCSNADGHWARRWFGLSLLSILVPCLCCYLPLMSCYRCGVACKVCGTRHEPSWSSRRRQPTNIKSTGLEIKSFALKPFLHGIIFWYDVLFFFQTRTLCQISEPISFNEDINI